MDVAMRSFRPKYPNVTEIVAAADCLQCHQERLSVLSHNRRPRVEVSLAALLRTPDHFMSRFNIHSTVPYAVLKYQCDILATFVVAAKR
jgi:hypothetical protein